MRGRRAAIVLALASPGCFSLLFDAGDLPARADSDGGPPAEDGGEEAAADGGIDADAAGPCGPTDFCDDFELDGLVSPSRWSRQTTDDGTLALDDTRFKRGSRGLVSIVPAAPRDGGSYTTRRAWLERDLAARQHVRCTFWVNVAEPAKSEVYGIDFFQLIASNAELSGYEIHFGIGESSAVAGFREDVYFRDGGSDDPRIKKTLDGATFTGWTHVTFSADLAGGTFTFELRNEAGGVIGALAESGGFPVSSPGSLAIRLGLQTKDPAAADVAVDDLRCEDAL